MSGTSRELTEAEREVLREGGLDLSRPPSTDPLAAPAALPTDLHPVAVHDFYTRPDADLVIDEDVEGPGMTPSGWLHSGGDPAVLGAIAKRL